MSEPPSGPEPEDAERRLEELLERLGATAPVPSPWVGLWLAFFPPAIGLVGAAVAYELSGSLAQALTGLLLGAGTGYLWARDFVRWRLHPLTALLTLGLFGLFAWAYLV